MTTLVIPGYTRSVKTAISVPDETFERVTRRAKELGMSRSELFTRAAVSYLDDLDGESLTSRIDEAVDLIGVDGDSAAAVQAGRRRLAEDDW
jgi:hypothetical protein